ncbi:hypothetical protein ScPMuIL_007015 [Solemya velum]
MARRERSAVSSPLKWFLFFLNFLLLLIGMAFTAMGTYILVEKNKTVNDAIDFFFDPACLMCSAGSIIVFIAYFGCTGALRENTCFLLVYYVSMWLMFAVEMVVVVLIFIFYYVPDARKKLDLYPEDAFKDAMKKYGLVNDEDMQDLIDNLQKSFKCCGWSNDVEGYQDWDINPYFNCNKSNPSPERCSVPPSCCQIRQGQTINILCGQGVRVIDKDGMIVDGDLSKIYTDGCLKALGSWIDSNALVVGGVMLGILLPQIFLLCISNTFKTQIKMQRAKWKESPTPSVRPSAPSMSDVFREHEYI